MDSRRNWCLIGIPDHSAVYNLGGRVGAAHGPKAFRRVFDRFKGRDGVLETRVDRGDVDITNGQIEKNHRRAADQIRDAHSENPCSVVVGGAHDHGFSHLLGYKEALEKKAGKEVRIGCLNIDAHLDVRKPDPNISSGSPFYLALETSTLQGPDLVEFGIQPQANGADLWNYVETQKVEVVPYGDLRAGNAIQEFDRALKALAARCDGVAISFDLDAVAQSAAPGVSAPQAEGFNTSEVFQMMELAAKEPKVGSLGLFELNPEHDRDEMTARLAATAAYRFVAGKQKLDS